MPGPPDLAMRSWDTRLAGQLDEVTVTAPLAAGIAARVIPLVQRFGFAIVASEPCASDPTATAGRSRELLEFGRALGVPIVQSPRRELVEDVRDFTDVDEHDDRGYRSGGELSPHSDPPTLNLLHCVQPARRGGESRLVCVASIVQRMLDTDPAAVDELFAPLPDWRVPGQYGVVDAGPAAPRPVLARRDGALSCVLYRPYIELSARTAGPELTDAQSAALDLFDACAAADDLTVRFTLGRGETLVLHNRTVLHARTDYVDWPDPDRRRHLLRMWIDAPDRFPVHPDHELGDFFAAPRPAAPSPAR